MKHSITMKKLVKFVTYCIQMLVHVCGRTSSKLNKNGNYEILLYASSATSINHLIKYYDIMRSEGINFYIFPSLQGYSINDSKIMVAQKIESSDIKIVNRFAAAKKRWDLKVVCATDGLKEIIAPTLYIGHGDSSKSRDGGITKYPYEGKLFADIMLEPRRSAIKYIVSRNEIYKDRIVWSGHKDAKKVSVALRRRKNIRKQLGVENKTVLLVWGSFGKNSLFHKMGESLLRELELLDKDVYTVILSIHPHEYRQYDSNIKPLGKLIDGYRNKRGFIVRDPSEDYIEYIVSCDIMICDNSSAVDVALLASRPLALLEADNQVWQHSDYISIREEEISVTEKTSIIEILDMFEYRNAELKEISKRFGKELVSPDGGYDVILRDLSVKMMKDAHTSLSPFRK